MSKLIDQQPCPSCSKSGQGKSLAVYEDGEYCFECGYTGGDMENSTEKFKGFRPLPYPDLLKGRGVTKDILQKFDYKVGMYTGRYGDKEVLDMAVHAASLHAEDGTLVGYQLRNKDKEFWAIGNTKDLSLQGMHLYNPNPNVFVTVVEGYIDQLSVAQACGSQFPVVTVPNGSASAYRSIKKNLTWLQGFKYVVLALDNDEAGKEATEKVLPLFTPGKVRVATWPQKDANDMLLKGDYAGIKSVLFNASEHKPDGLKKLSEYTEEDFSCLFQKGFDIPFPILNEKLRGFFPGKFYSFVAAEKSGKSLLTKELVLYMMEKGLKLGLIYLEETDVEAVGSLAAMANNMAMWRVKETSDPDYMKKLMATYCREAAKKSDPTIYVHKGIYDLEKVIERMTYMAKAEEVDYIILDNSSLSFAGIESSKEERTIIGNFVSKCVSLVNNSKTSILSVSHLKKNIEETELKKSPGGGLEEVPRSVKTADIYGSGSIAKFSYAIVALEPVRGQDKVKLNVLADRNRGRTGYADTLKYNDVTGRLTIDKTFSEGVL
jgi:hypothetical protein